MYRLLFVAIAIVLSVFLPIESSAQCPNPPSVIVPEWEMVKAGDTVGFQIRRPNGELDPGEFAWEVTNGTIVSGQGTNQIVVSTSPTALETNYTKIELKPDDKHGYIFQGSFGRQIVRLKVVAGSIGKSGCSETRLDQTISIGKYSIESIANRPADATNLTLSETTDPTIVDVSTKAIDLDNDPLVYNYTVTAGKIIGSGANVKWDLTGVLPGTYEIKVGVDDGCGFCGKTVTRTFVLN